MNKKKVTVVKKKWVKEQTINHTQGKGGVGGDRDTYNGACALCRN